MSWEAVEQFLEEGGSGPEVMAVVRLLRESAELRAALRDELLLHYSAGDKELDFQLDLYLLDDFLQGRTAMPVRAQVLSAVAQDEKLWERLQQLFKTQQAADDFPPGIDDSYPPREVRESAEVYKVADETEVVTLAALKSGGGHWQIRDLDPAFRYEIKTRSASSLGGTGGRVTRVDEATVSRGDVRCGISYSPQAGRLEIQILNPPLEEGDFFAAVCRLRGRENVLAPATKNYTRTIARIVFDGVNPEETYLLEIDPRVIGG